MRENVIMSYIYIKRGYYLRVALISLSTLQVRLLFEGGYYSECGYYSNKYGTYFNQMSADLSWAQKGSKYTRPFPPFRGGVWE